MKNQNRPEKERSQLAWVMLLRQAMGDTHPTHPDQLCETRCQRWSQSFELPEGLTAGDVVRTVRSEEGFWIVEGLKHPGRFWRIPGFLLEVISRS